MTWVESSGEKGFLIKYRIESKLYGRKQKLFWQIADWFKEMFWIESKTQDLTELAKNCRKSNKRWS